jgi:hypothetical protein
MPFLALTLSRQGKLRPFSKSTTAFLVDSTLPMESPEERERDRERKRERERETERERD